MLGAPQKLLGEHGIGPAGCIAGERGIELRGIANAFGGACTGSGRWFDHDGESHLGHEVPGIGRRRDETMTRHGNTGGTQHVLHAGLVAKLVRRMTGETTDAESFAHERQGKLRLFVGAETAGDGPMPCAELANGMFELRGP